MILLILDLLLLLLLLCCVLIFALLLKHRVFLLLLVIDGDDLELGALVGTATLVVGHNLLFRVHVEQLLLLGVRVRRYQASYLLLFQKDRAQVLVTLQDIVSSTIFVLRVARAIVLRLFIID